jgi:1,4-alpha-glucan branching enzyme
MFGSPRPRYAIFAPCFTSAGPAAFSRDRESSKQVWSALEGYPGDPVYRDFYRDVGYDLDLDYLRPFLPPDGNRKFIGIKYYRITGRSGPKEIYIPGWAQGAVDHHAWDFMASRTKQLEHLIDATNIEPIVLSPFDAELFGHWWFEGPSFLNLFIRKAVYDQKTFELTTPSRYLERHDTLQIISPSPSRLLGSLARRIQFLDLSPFACRSRADDGERAQRTEAKRQMERARASANGARAVVGTIERLGFSHEDRHRASLRG